MQITLTCGFGGTQFRLLHTEASASINPEEGKPVILGLPLDISLVFCRNSLPAHLCCLTPNTGLLVSMWKCRVPSPCLAWPASGCPWLIGLHVKCRLSAHHLQSISSGASGNFPLPCPLLSPLILFSWDKGYPVSLLSPPVCWSPACCVVHSPRNTPWKLACKVHSLLWDWLVSLCWTWASGHFPRSPQLHAVS